MELLLFTAVGISMSLQLADRLNWASEARLRATALCQRDAEMLAKSVDAIARSRKTLNRPVCTVEDLHRTDLALTIR